MSAGGIMSVVSPRGVVSAFAGNRKAPSHSFKGWMKMSAVQDPFAAPRVRATRSAHACVQHTLC
eukprot:2434496-Pleurochrysis_carterae.AAC.1